ncbi:GxxExxY protein [Rubellicoccus peritrichatus]|uniref:GxxExxY protein n=1 Tax=Rubellicoccus peritrichatus TaxID=3080537 RepID=A0AAQ3LCJ5_9BACT|nr:GxxExxY protein [Puniceicoccus sp. CR14]WOO41068.1 GxxExxY protein [Puniceicoccus sp. CR14]
MNTDSKVRDPETYAIIGAAMTVHRELGHGFLENVYQEALETEFIALGIPYRREAEIAVIYRGEKLKASYRADFICFESIIVELKALTKLTSNEQAQILNYLKASSFQRGLLFNFGVPSLDYKRFILTQKNLCESLKSADS